MLVKLVEGYKNNLSFDALDYWQVWLALGLYLALFYIPALWLTHLDAEKLPENRFLDLPKLLALCTGQAIAANLLLLVAAPMLLGFGDGFAFDFPINYVRILNDHLPNHIVKQFGFGLFIALLLMLIYSYGKVSRKRKIILGCIAMYSVLYTLSILDFDVIAEERQRMFNRRLRHGSSAIERQLVTFIGTITWATTMIIFVNLEHILRFKSVRFRVVLIPFIAVITSIPVIALAELLGVDVASNALQLMFSETPK